METNATIPLASTLVAASKPAKLTVAAQVMLITVLNAVMYSSMKCPHINTFGISFT